MGEEEEEEGVGLQQPLQEGEEVEPLPWGEVGVQEERWTWERKLEGWGPSQVVEGVGPCHMVEEGVGLGVGPG